MAYRDRIIEVRTVPASSIVPQDVNPNLHDDQQKTSLRSALDRRGITGIPIVVERQGKLRMIDGHLRREVLGDQPVKVAVLDLTEKEEREELVAHDQITRLARVDPTAQLELVEQTEPEALESLGLTEEAVEELRSESAGEPPPLEDRPTLVERFGAPPFSVFDARQGYWQDRKRQWMALGIQSELGRGGGVWVESEHTGSPIDRQRRYSGGGGSPRRGDDAQQQDWP